MTAHACTKIGWQNTWESRLPASMPPWASTSERTEAEKCCKSGEKLTPPIIQEGVRRAPESTSGTESTFIPKMCEIDLRMRVHLHQQKRRNSVNSLRERNIHELPETGQNRPRDRSTLSLRKMRNTSRSLQGLKEISPDFQCEVKRPQDPRSTFMQNA